jgi:hypothetical protein
VCINHERCSCHWRTYECDNCDEIETTDGELPEGWTNVDLCLCPVCTKREPDFCPHCIAMSKEKW